MVNSFLTFFWPVETSEVHAHSSGIIVFLHGFIPSPSHQGRVQISLPIPYKLLTGDLMFYFTQSKHEKFYVSVPSSCKWSRVQVMPSIVWSEIRKFGLSLAVKGTRSSFLQPVNPVSCWAEILHFAACSGAVRVSGRTSYKPDFQLNK